MCLQKKSLSAQNSGQPHGAGLASHVDEDEEETAKRDDMICGLLVQLAWFAFLSQHGKAKTS